MSLVFVVFSKLFSLMASAVAFLMRSSCSGVMDRCRGYALTSASVSVMSNAIFVKLRKLVYQEVTDLASAPFVELYTSRNFLFLSLSHL